MSDSAFQPKHPIGPGILLVLLATIAFLLGGAIFGFFYAYSVSVIWGLDATDPKSAIAAMQGINRVVRNAAFAPAFFGTPLALAASALLACLAASRLATVSFSLATVTYFFGALMPTFLVNVPMNDALAAQVIPAGMDEAIWRDYSRRWLWWNHLRMAMSGLALLLTGAAIYALGRKSSIL